MTEKYEAEDLVKALSDLLDQTPLMGPEKQNITDIFRPATQRSTVLAETLLRGDERQRAHYKALQQWGGAQIKVRIESMEEKTRPNIIRMTDAVYDAMQQMHAMLVTPGADFEMAQAAGEEYLADALGEEYARGFGDTTLRALSTVEAASAFGANDVPFYDKDVSSLELTAMLEQRGVDDLRFHNELTELLSEVRAEKERLHPSLSTDQQVEIAALCRRHVAYLIAETFPETNPQKRYNAEEIASGAFMITAKAEAMLGVLRGVMVDDEVASFYTDGALDIPKIRAVTARAKSNVDERLKPAGMPRTTIGTDNSTNVVPFRPTGRGRGGGDGGSNSDA